MKTAERAHTPKDLWESIKLDPSYNKALEQIDTELQYWPKFLIHKCKQRFTRLRQILIKRRKMKLEGSAEYRVVSHKAERREVKRLTKITKSAMIENQVRNGLLENIKNKKYNDIYNINKEEFEKVLETEKDQELEDEEFNEEDYDPGYTLTSRNTTLTKKLILKCSKDIENLIKENFICEGVVYFI